MAKYKYLTYVYACLSSFLLVSTFIKVSESNFQNDAPVSVKKATFGMGCFWEPDAVFGVTKGVLRTRVGYTGGTTEHPTYLNLGDYTEAIDMDYNSHEILYSDLLNLFWKNHNPTEANTKQYASYIYYHDEEQQRLASTSLKSRQELIGEDKIVTQIMPASEFFEAEVSHQKYRLQQAPEIFSQLSLNTRDDIVNSKTAARLNGYLAGKGSLTQFDEMSNTLGLNKSVLDDVRKIIETSENKNCHSNCHKSNKLF